jgi:hypothetical protein
MQQQEVRVNVRIAIAATVTKSFMGGGIVE